MRMTGISHKARVFFLLEFEFDTTRYPTTGIIVNAGFLVYIARPRKIPDNNTSRFLFMLILGHCWTLLFFGLLMYIANRIEDKSKGMSKVSKYILRRIHVIGITAKRTDAIRATFLLYRLSDNLYIKKVSTTARIPIITLGTKWSISIDWTSGVGCNEFGYPTAPNNPAKNNCPKYGWS